MLIPSLNASNMIHMNKQLTTREKKENKNGTGLQNPCRSQVWVVMGVGTGVYLPTHEQQKEPKKSQNS